MSERETPEFSSDRITVPLGELAPASSAEAAASAGKAMLVPSGIGIWARSVISNPKLV